MSRKSTQIWSDDKEWLDAQLKKISEGEFGHTAKYDYTIEQRPELGGWLLKLLFNDSAMDEGYVFDEHDHALAVACVWLGNTT